VDQHQERQRDRGEQEPRSPARPSRGWRRRQRALVGRTGRGGAIWCEVLTWRPWAPSLAGPRGASQQLIDSSSTPIDDAGQKGYRSAPRPPSRQRGELRRGTDFEAARSALDAIGRPISNRSWGIWPDGLVSNVAPLLLGVFRAGARVPPPGSRATLSLPGGEEGRLPRATRLSLTRRACTMADASPRAMNIAPQGRPIETALRRPLVLVASAPEE